MESSTVTHFGYTKFTLSTRKPIKTHDIVHVTKYYPKESMNGFTFTT
ncbi:Putative uncharacterized protein [Moritella viscosa]|nr:Putative uncharacterized protein [Moritella viscosa]